MKDKPKSKKATSTPRRGTAGRPKTSLVDCLLPAGHPHAGAK